MRSAASWLAVGWLLFVAVPSYEPVRAMLTRPLFRHQPESRGDVAYVMSGGHAIQERLRAAADLYQMHRVGRIVIADDTSNAAYNFVDRRSESRSEQASRYLDWLGVPQDRILRLEVAEEPWLGSLAEARRFMRKFAGTQDAVVVVTSAPHSRRSELSFRRAADGIMDVNVYAASRPSMSAELFHPIWIEYIKLAVYQIVA